MVLTSSLSQVALTQPTWGSTLSNSVFQIVAAAVGMASSAASSGTSGALASSLLVTVPSQNSVEDEADVRFTAGSSASPVASIIPVQSEGAATAPRPSTTAQGTEVRPEAPRVRVKE